MISSEQPLVLVDGSSYLYRAFHAMPSLMTSSGEPTGAVYGVTNMLRRLMSDYPTRRIAVVFDAKGKTFREELFPEYKAHRPSMPSELSRQIAPLFEIVRAMGLPLVSVEGVEADDVIGSLTCTARQRGIPVVISTGDKDMAQLVDESVTLVNTMTETVLNPKGVAEKFGVPPERIVDYLALIGDTSDNIPGVPKVGPKTAAKWLEEYGSLEVLLARADEVGGKIGDNLRECAERLPLNKRLVTIKCDVPIPIRFDDLILDEPDRERLKELYKRLEFKGWLAELLARDGELSASEEPRVDQNSGTYEMVLSETHFREWMRRLEQAELFAFDTETTGLDYITADIVGVSFSIKRGEAAYVPLGHDYVGAPHQLDRHFVLESLRPLLEDEARPKVGQNLKFDMSVLAKYGIALRGIAHDTMLQSYILDSAAARHDLYSLALKYLGRKTLQFEDVAGKGSKQIGFNQVDVESATAYSGEDADLALQLHETLWPRLCAETGLRRVYEEIEIPLVPVLSRMERAGVLIDDRLLQQQSCELAAAIADIEREAFVEAGQEFNLSSPKQIQALLFEKQRLPVLAKTSTGQPSTAENVLQELALDYRLPQLILQHRGLAKLKSTYTDSLPAQINQKSRRVHSNFQQAVAATGRLSSSDPNLQNIPVRTAEGRRIRQAFVAPEGYRLVAADYSQIELRIMAHLSRDARLNAAFASKEDVHRATAAEVFGIPPHEVTHDHRRAAKAINFGLIYGMSAFGLAQQLGIDRASAQSYVDLYFARYTGVKEFMEATKRMAREKGYVETLFGRRLYLPDINASNIQRRQYAERTAINAPMQGSAADIIKRAMVRLDHWSSRMGEGVRMIMQVHDELVFEIRTDLVDEALPEIRKTMESAAELSVPLLVEVGVGQNWDEAH